MICFIHVAITETIWNLEIRGRETDANIVFISNNAVDRRHDMLRWLFKG